MGTKIMVWLGTYLLATMIQAAPHTQAETSSRILHARELMGVSYQESVVKHAESTQNISEFIHETTKRFLPAAYQNQSRSIANAIMSEAENAALDPIFLMAMIQNESGFLPTRKGTHGEIGLMQVKPDTARWIANEYQIPYQGSKTLYNPIMNIKIGVAYLDKLRSQFNSKSHLYLSAYNIGARKVRLLSLNHKFPKEYIRAVMKRYLAIYEGLATEGSSKSKSEMAWKQVLSITQNLAKN